MFKKIFLFIFLFFCLFQFSTTVQAVGLQDAFGTKLQKVAGSEGAGYQTTGTSLEGTVGLIINTILSLLGVVFLVLIIYGGYLWMTAVGNETQVGKAKNVITASVIGLIIIVSSYAISVFVINALQSGTLQSGPAAPTTSN